MRKTRVPWPVALREWWLPALGLAILALAGWARAPAVPNLASLRGGTHGSQAVAELSEELARAVPSDPAAAFAKLPGAHAGDPEWGLILYEDGRPFAWSGRTRIPTDSITAPVSIVSTPFYTVMAVSAATGRRRAIGTSVVTASPPADRVSYTIAERATSRAGVAGFALSAPPRAGESVVLGDSSSGALLSAQPIPLSAGEIRLRAVERSRSRIVVVLALAILVFLTIAWRRGGGMERAAALAVALTAVALVPFNAFSGRTRLFDAAYYFSPSGGPWTANGGVFLFSAALVVLGVLTMIRGRARVRDARLALGLAAILIVAGYFTLRALAAGIGEPARGASLSLWLSWEVPLFLTAAAFLLPVAWIVDTGLRHRRSLRRSSSTAATVLAAMIAVTLVWVTTVRQRQRLAEADVVSLERGEDQNLDVLLARFVGTLSAEPAPRDRIALLQQYAASELAIAGYRVAMHAWDASGAVTGSLDLTRGLADVARAAAVRTRALSVRRTIVEKVPGLVGIEWVAAVPNEDGSVTTVVAAPRSLVVDPDPFLPLLGLGSQPTQEPSYSITLAEGRLSAAAPSIAWRRTGNELHADAPVHTVRGLERAHLEVDLRAPEALIQRLGLVVLLDAVLLALLSLLTRAAEPGFARRARVRLRHWTGSYRARLTLVLFGFFLVPAATFAVWGYQRLAIASRQARQLVVRETLHAADAAHASDPLSQVSRELGTPLFAYANGTLVATNDSLYDAIVPVGRTLPPGVHLNLDVADELTASWEERVGDVPVLLGYRVARGPGHPVLAAPSRGEDPNVARRARDLGVLLAFAAALGALAALWLSGVVAHQFGRPIAALRRAARAVARGDRQPPPLPRAPSEFTPVFTAFRRMGADLERSRMELARAARVLAWGEMARQVAHEIKNPLTPMRLGVQHLQRARHDPRVDFDKVFEENTRRILEEIERLDEIARAFSRYGSGPAELPPAEAIEVAGELRDIVAFERMGAEELGWELAGAEGKCSASARAEELREVLMNVYENARAARARRVVTTLRCGGESVTIEVADDGTGIAADDLSRIFEPHFSTRTAGSGLGLAISRRLLESWGGSIAIGSREGVGTVVTITLRGG